MSWRERIAVALSPPAEVGRLDTGLRFTDILFGFVIRELFLRLQNWGSLPWFVRWQLIVGTALVLGSWIGFRRSLNRSTYEVKFFNLPFFRFVLDQGMVLLYFRIATRTPNEAQVHLDADSLTQATIGTVLLIFVLYLLWDVGAIWMASVKKDEDDKPKYAKIDPATNKPTAEPVPRDWWGLAITFGFAAAFGLLMLVTYHRHLHAYGADKRLLIAALLLILYRFFKEVRTSWRTAPSAPAGATASPSVSTAPVGKK